VFDKTGRLNELAGEFAGLKMLPARKAIVEKLKEQGLLLKAETLIHTSACHERCGATVEFHPEPAMVHQGAGPQRRLFAAGAADGMVPAVSCRCGTRLVKGSQGGLVHQPPRYSPVPFPLLVLPRLRRAGGRPAGDICPVDPTQTPPRPARAAPAWRRRGTSSANKM
jgi:hypothetical protein